MGHFQNIDVNEQRNNVHAIDTTAISATNLVVTQGVTIAAFGLNADAINGQGGLGNVIFNHADLFSAAADGIDLSDVTSFASFDTVINDGDIVARENGVYMGGSDATTNRLDNDGDIFSLANAGVRMTGERQTVDNGLTGEISGYEVGVYINGQGADLSNDGSIDSQKRGSFGVQLVDIGVPSGAQLNNVIHNTGRISAAGAEHLSASGTFETVFQGAAIEISADQNFGGPKTTVVTNTGVIQHEQTAITTRIVRESLTETGIAVVSSTDSREEIINSGQIFGEIILGETSDANGDRVENQAGGEINGGIFFGGGDSELLNHGSVIANPQFDNTDPFIIEFGSGDDILTNSGEITLETIDMGQGINILDNSGTINATVFANGFRTTLTNSGTMSQLVSLGNDQDTVVNTGTMAGGLNLNGDDDMLTNGPGGTIAGLGLGSGNDEVSNAGTISAGDAASGRAIRGFFGTKTIANSGEILGDIENDSTTNLDNSGSIIGDIEAGSLDALITNSGSIRGGVALEEGDNSLHNTGSMMGNVFAGSGDDQLQNHGEFQGAVFLNDGDDTLDNLGKMAALLFDVPLIDLGEGNDVATNKGELLGGLDLGEGDNQAINEGLLNGDVVALDGADAIINRGTIGGDVDTGGGNDTVDTRGGDVAGAIRTGAGDDTISVDRADLDLIELLDGGTDTVRSSADFELGDNFETLDLIGNAVLGVGNALANTLNGNHQRNTLLGQDGNDIINGGAGDDHIRGGNDNDILSGGAQDDLLRGQRGNDQLFGGDGEDRLEGHGNDDTLQGDKGDDSIIGGSGDDLIIWNNGDGSDIVDGGTGTDTQRVNGADGAGDEFVVSDGGAGLILFNRLNLGPFQLDLTDVERIEVNGQGGDDTLTATTSGIDIIFDGGDGEDTLTGEDGDDQLLGGAGDDTLTGGNGDDFLSGDAGADVLDGGAGFDVASYASASAGVKVDRLVPANNLGDALGDTLIGIERVEGSAFDDDLRGLGATDRLVGEDGNDSLIGRGSRDILEGGEGNDVLLGGTGDDDLEGGAGRDFLRGDAGIDRALYINAAAGVTVDMLDKTRNTGDAEGDTVLVENIEGSDFGDDLGGDDLANHLRGRDGDDTLAGRDGDDTLEGGGGSDLLTGGAGADSFLFTAPNQAGDTITDFTVGTDTIDFRSVTFGGLPTGTLAASQFVVGVAADADDFFLYDAGTGDLFFDADGNGAGAALLMATLTGAPAISASDIEIV